MKELKRYLNKKIGRTLTSILSSMGLSTVIRIMAWLFSCRSPLYNHRKWFAKGHVYDWHKMVFCCGLCGRIVCGWCEGCDDDEYEYCDNCWFDKNTSKEEMRWFLESEK